MSDCEGQANSSVEVQRVEELAEELFGGAKLRWGWSVGLGYLVVGIVPIVLLLEGPKWLALIVGAIASLVVATLRWSSDSVRRDADCLRRMHDISVSLGHPLDWGVVADIKARPSVAVTRKETTRPSQEGYFSATGAPSPRLLVTNMRESSWYTAKLADTAKRVVYAITAVPFVATVCLIALADSKLVQAYGIMICVVVLMDMFRLAVSYGHLSNACDGAFNEFGTLAKDHTLSERRALLSATNYHFVRCGGPFIPDWLWRTRREKLNAVWGQLTANEKEKEPGQSKP